MSELEIWKMQRDDLQEYFKSGRTGPIGFLTEHIETEPGGFAGTDREYFFRDGNFYSVVEHWDAAGGSARASGKPELVSKSQFIKILNKKKLSILRSIPASEKKEFEALFNEVTEFLIDQIR